MPDHLIGGTNSLVGIVSAGLVSITAQYAVSHSAVTDTEISVLPWVFW